MPQRHSMLQKLSYHMCNLVCILQGWSEQAAGQTHRQGQEANHRKPDHRLREIERVFKTTPE